MKLSHFLQAHFLASNRIDIQGLPKLMAKMIRSLDIPKTVIICTSVTYQQS